MSADRTIVFEIHRDGELVREEVFEQDEIKIGSSERAHLVLDDEGVARLHAVLRVEDDGNRVTIMELGTGRPLLVNGDAVKREQLHHGDAMQLGSTEMVFNYYAAGATAASSGAGHQSPGQVQKVESIPDSLAYSRRYLSKPASTDGSVEVAVLSNDYVIFDELYRPPKDLLIGGDVEPSVGRLEVPEVMKGEEGRIDIPLVHPLLPAEGFPLIECSSGTPRLQFTSAMEGEVYIGQQRYALNDLISSGKASVQGTTAWIDLNDDVRAKLQFDDVSIFIHRTTEAVFAPPMQFGSLRMVGFIAGSAIVHLLLLALALLYPTAIDNLDDDELNRDDRWVRLISQEEIEEPEEPEWMEKDADSTGEEGAAESESEAEDTKSKTDSPSEQTTDDAQGELSRSEAKEEALNTGALAALKQFGASSTFSSANAGYQNLEFVGNDSSAEATYGQQGMGRFSGGIASGGGGAAAGGVSGGPIAVRGRVSGERIGSSRRGISDRKARRVAVTPGNPAVQGQLDREIIQRVIRQHRREIRTCYESQLQSNPDLAGRVVVAFVIDPTGTVAGSNIAKSSLGNSAVEQCIRTRVRRWRFPEPRGGGIVKVNYPFVFTSG